MSETSETGKIPSLAETHRLALGAHQDSVDQACAVAELMLKSLDDSVNGGDIDAAQLFSALKLVVQKLQTVDCLADSIALGQQGEILQAMELIHMEAANG
jgi:hypothetical protein